MELKISELTPSQIKAVWESEQFCMLTDRQLAALHHRRQYLADIEQWHKRRKRADARSTALVMVLCIVLPFTPGLLVSGVLFGMSATSCNPETGRFCRN